MHQAQAPKLAQQQPPDEDDLSLIRGGLFYRLQRATKLIDEDRWLFGRRVILAVAITWLPVLMLTAFFNPHGFSSLLRDYRVYARLLIAVPVLIMGQLLMETRFRIIVSHIRESGLLDETGMGHLREVMEHLRRWRDGIVPELVVIALAYGHTFFIWKARVAMAPDWAVYHVSGVAHVTPAGLYFGLVSQIVYQILVGWCLWKWVLWAVFLFKLSRMKLHLVATHPDGHGGLGFLGLSPLGLSPIALAASTVIGSNWRYQILHLGAHLRDFALSGGVLLGIVVLIALGPLAFFIRDLATLRRQAILQYGTLAQMHSSDFHDKWILHRGGHEEEFLTAPESSTLADFGTAYENIEEMMPFPLDKGALMGLAVAVLLPMLPVVLAEIPLIEVLKDLMEAVK